MVHHLLVVGSSPILLQSYSTHIARWTNEQLFDRLNEIGAASRFSGRVVKTTKLLKQETSLNYSGKSYEKMIKVLFSLKNIRNSGGFHELTTGKSGHITIKCSFQQHISSRAMTRHVLSGLAASFIFLSQTSQVVAGDISSHHNFCQLARAANNELTLPLDEGSDGGSEKMMMTRGMTAKNFDPIRYSGRWFEVASLKRGFAGQGQEDCHCTQGVYTFDMNAPSIQVDTFCVHGGPDGYITGIRGKVQCIPEEDVAKDETELEKQEMIREKCHLRFPTLPFIPKLPYDVIATDYDNFALVSGAKDRGFVQIYSRTPVPGPEFTEKYKDYLANFGYDPSKIKDTPQDCEVMSNSQLAAMMSMNGMQQALTNQFPDLGLNSAVQFDPFTSVFETLKKLVQLYFKQ